MVFGFRFYGLYKEGRIVEATHPWRAGEDALSFGARLKAEVAEQREVRIASALSVGNPADGQVSLHIAETREHVARLLFDVFYSEQPEMPLALSEAEEVLDRFCWALFGCTFAEVLEAWSRRLG